MPSAAPFPERNPLRWAGPRNANPGASRGPGSPAAARNGRPVPIRRTEEAARPLTLRERLEESMPFLFVGGFFLAAAVWALLSAAHIGSTRYPIWLLFLMLGLTSTGGGTLALFAEDEAPTEGAPRVPPGYRLVAEADLREISGRIRMVARRLPGAMAPWREPPEPVSRSPTPDAIPSPGRPEESLPRTHEEMASEIRDIEDALTAPPRWGSVGEPGASTGGVSHRVAGLGSDPAASPLSSQASALLGSSIEGTDPVRRQGRCVGCDTPTSASPEGTSCQVCGRPVCASCVRRGTQEGASELCPVCAVLEEYLPDPERAPRKGAPTGTR